MKLSSIVLVLLVGCTCELTAVRPAERCAHYHSETGVEYGIGGVPIGGQNFGEFGPQIGESQVCDRYETYLQEFCVQRRWFWEDK